jgi:hypothetical protein
MENLLLEEVAAHQRHDRPARHRLAFSRKNLILLVRRRLMMLEMLHLDAAEIAKVGIRAIEKAHAAGVPAYYVDRALGDGIVKAMPDGTLHLIDSTAGDDVVLRTFRPDR